MSKEVLWPKETPEEQRAALDRWRADSAELEARPESRREAYWRQLEHANRNLLVHPAYLRRDDVRLDSPRTSIEDIEWVIKYHEKEIALAKRELRRRQREEVRERNRH